MVMKFFEGDTKGAAEIQLKAIPLIHALFSEVNPIPVKAALNLMGKEVDHFVCHYPRWKMQTRQNLLKN